MTAIIDEILDLFARFGSGTYGEDLSLERHMLQSAAMAQSLGADDKVIAAALLHDIGYFLYAYSEASLNAGRDFAHESLGATWLSRGFYEAVTAPIALHVSAKRYLCAVEPGYFDHLSDASRRSLAVQGGVMTEAEVQAFARLPAFEAAVILRRCDDLGKDVAAPTGGIEHYRGLLESCIRRSS